MKKSVFFNFISIVLVFLIGIIIGMIFINHTSNDEILKITSYINDLKENIKTGNINSFSCLIESLKQNCIIVLLIWVLGSTIIGSFFIYFVILYKGFSIGYTVSAIIASLGIRRGSVFVFSFLFMQNIILLPALFILAKSGLKVYIRIMKNHVDIKTELIRHLIIMLIVLIISVVSSIVEVYISTNLLIFLKNFI